MKKNEHTFNQAELELLKEGLNRSYKDRFEIATPLYKIQQIMKKASFQHKPFISKQLVDIFDEGILDFWRALQEYRIQYIMVGGYAINLNGYQRFTSDLDIWLKDTLKNRQKLRKAIIKCDIGDYPMFDDMQFIPGWTETGFKIESFYE